MKLKFGVTYFFIHLLIEVVTFFVLGNYVSFEQAVLLSLVYDFLAFVPQGIFGYILDEKIKYPALLIGIVMAVLSVTLLYTNINPFINIGIISISSCLIHIAGAERTLRESDGKMTPAALFVAGGSYGVFIGKSLAKYGCPIWVVILISLLLLVPFFYLSKQPLDYEKTCENYNFANEKINPIVVIILATVVVAVRSFVSFYIPTSWNKELYQTISLFAFMGLGKALGGVLIDTIGIKWTGFISTILSLPFLIFGNNNMVLSIIGIMLFSMTMAVTLALIVSCMKKRPGVAFGMTTIGLFLGVFPLFIFKITDIKIATILVTILGIISLVLLFIISGRNFVKRGKNYENI